MKSMKIICKSRKMMNKEFEHDGELWPMWSAYAQKRCVQPGWHALPRLVTERRPTRERWCGRPRPSPICWSLLIRPRHKPWRPRRSNRLYTSWRDVVEAARCAPDLAAAHSVDPWQRAIRHWEMCPNISGTLKILRKTSYQILSADRSSTNSNPRTSLPEKLNFLRRGLQIS
jgi:hypothetical protein